MVCPGTLLRLGRRLGGLPSSEGVVLIAAERPPSGTPRRHGAVRAAALGTAALATAGLWAISKGKWSDPIVDSGREWIVPDALSRGELLYRDVVYWFGPFTPYFHAAFFRAFGSSFETLALAGTAGAAAVLLCLHLALRGVTDARHAWAWTVVAIPSLVFMPDSGGAILGMGFRIWHAAGFGLLAVTLASRSPDAAWLDLSAGAAAALAGLCRTEWGVAALAGSGVAIALRSSAAGSSRAALGRLIGAFLLVLGGGLGYFLLRAGPLALLRDAPVLLFNLPVETRTHVARIEPSVWFRGGVQMAYAALAWIAAFLALDLLSRARSEPGVLRRRLPMLVVLLLLAGFCAAIGGFPHDVLFAAAPLLCAVSIFVAVRLPRGRFAATLGGCGSLGVLASYRRPFFIADGPYVAPPLLFAVVCAAGCLTVAVATRERGAQRRLSAWLLAAIGALAAVLFVVRALQYRSDDRVPIAGTGGMLSARAETARSIEALGQSIRRATAQADGLVVFPEGEVFNFLSGRPNPIRHKLYLPGYLNPENEAEILAELDRARPGVVVIWPRPLGEYGSGRFGADYGTSIRSWIREGYAEEPIPGVPDRSSILAVRRRR